MRSQRRRRGMRDTKEIEIAHRCKREREKERKEREEREERERERERESV